MKLVVRNMTENDAVDILTWKYEKPYDFYNNILSGSAILELLNRSYKVITDEQAHVIGFFCIGKAAQVPAGEAFHVYDEDCIDLGIGMKPSLTGKGNGHTFFQCILGYVMNQWLHKNIRLTVATFNERAIHLYEKFGFEKDMSFHHEPLEFITMIKYR